MYKVSVYSNGKLIAKHWYPIEQVDNAKNTAFALHNHPQFGFKTVLDLCPTAKIIYNAE